MKTLAESLRTVIECDCLDEADIGEQYKTIHDAAGLQPGLAPGGTEIWYVKSDAGRDLGMGAKFCLKHGYPLPDPKNLKKTHSLLGKIKEKDPKKILFLLQDEHWSPKGEARDLIKKLKGVWHTSMMVGDIVKIGNKVLMVDPIGFYDLVKGKSEDIELDSVLSESRGEKNVPPGYVVKNVTSKAKVINRSGSDFCFVVAGKVYDDYMRDYIGSICPTDPEEIVTIFRKSGYNDDEIKNIFDEFWRAKNFQALPLPRPVTVKFTVFKRSYGLPKGWTP